MFFFLQGRPDAPNAQDDHGHEHLAVGGEAGSKMTINIEKTNHPRLPNTSGLAVFGPQRHTTNQTPNLRRYLEDLDSLNKWLSTRSF